MTTKTKSRKGTTNADKAKAMYGQVMSRFEAGTIAQPLAQVFLIKGFNVPMQSWSYLNQLFCILSGCTDARGFNQWKAEGRKVIKGEKSRTFIRVPCKTKPKDDDSDDDAPSVYFRWIPLFDVNQTEGAELYYQSHVKEAIDALPFVNVAQSWGIKVEGTAANAKFYGRFIYGGSQPRIQMAVQNRATWLHELAHAAERKNGNLTIGKGQQWDNEVVAEMAGCVLCHLIGEPAAADEGGCYAYVKHYAQQQGMSVQHACTAMIERTAQAIATIMDTAEELTAA